jgi:hypothetical protein
MIFLILSLLYVFFLTYSYGWVSAHWLEKITGVRPEQKTIVVLIGLTVITTLGSIFSLFFRINWEFQALLLLGSIFIVIKYRLIKFRILKDFLPKKLGTLLLVFVFLVVGLVVLNAVTLEPTNSDTGIYHAQTIRWIETYPAVPGLANLHARFGYNSSWMMANAIFSFSFLGLRSFHFLTGFLFLISGLYFYSGVKNILDRKADISDVLKIGFLFSLFIFLINQSSSPGTDAPATIFIWVIICECVRLLEQKAKFNLADFFIVSIFAVFCITIKMSAAPLLLGIIPVLVGLLVERKLKLSVALIVTMAVLLLPFIARNLIISGYFVFPGPAIDLFRFDWRVPIETLQNEISTIHWFAAIPHMDQDQFWSLKMSEWVPIWFGNLIPRHKAILAGLIFLPFLLALLEFFKSWRKLVSDNRMRFVVLLFAYTGVVFWFLSAPAFRFGYGFLIGAVLLELAIIAKFFLDRIRFISKFVAYLILPVILAGVLGFSRSTFQPKGIIGRLVLPMDYPSWSTEPCTFKNFSILCQASYDSCWYSAFPCAIRGNENIEMRGSDFKQGFRTIIPK